MPARDLVCVGGSFGALEPLTNLLGALAPDLPAALLVTLHVPRDTPVALAEHFNGVSALPVVAATDHAPIERGHVYFAVPDRHLAVRNGSVRLQRTAHVNRHRPSIDVLFRTAARSYRKRTIGLVLSGQLDDGAAGLATIAGLGGVAVVQDPADALAPEMPRRALERAPGAHCVAAAGLAALLSRLVNEDGEGEQAPSVAPEVRAEWTASMIVCPHCGGSLKEHFESGEPMFACHVGHSFSMPSLVSAQSETVDDALWAAMRALEEQAATCQRAAKIAGKGELMRRLTERSEEAAARARIIRELLERDPV